MKSDENCTNSKNINPACVIRIGAIQDHIEAVSESYDKLHQEFDRLHRSVSVITKQLLVFDDFVTKNENASAKISETINEKMNKLMMSLGITFVVSCLLTVMMIGGSMWLTRFPFKIDEIMKMVDLKISNMKMTIMKEVNEKTNDDKSSSKPPPARRSKKGIIKGLSYYNRNPFYSLRNIP